MRGVTDFDAFRIFLDLGLIWMIWDVLERSSDLGGRGKVKIRLFGGEKRLNTPPIFKIEYLLIPWTNFGDPYIISDQNFALFLPVESD
jgi:hypothetical protein